MQSYGSRHLDASVLLLPLVGFLPADDERIAGTFAAIEKGLMEGGFVRRQEAPWLGKEEGVFLPCTCWLADGLATGRAARGGAGAVRARARRVQRPRIAVGGIPRPVRSTGRQLPPGVDAYRRCQHRAQPCAAPLCNAAAAESRTHQEMYTMTRVAVITGAGAGVGRAVAEEFARNGWHLALLSRDKDRLEHAAESLIGRYGIRAISVPTDVADADAMEDSGRPDGSPSSARSTRGSTSQCRPCSRRSASLPPPRSSAARTSLISAKSMA